MTDKSWLDVADEAKAPSHGLIVLFANTDWYLFNFRRSLALAIKASGYQVLLISPDGPFGPRLRDLGLRWEPLPMQRRSLRPDKEMAVIIHLMRLLRRERPLLIHNFTIKSAVYGSVAARMCGIHRRVNAIAGLGYVFTSKEWRARLLAPLVRLSMRLSLGGKQSRVVLQNPDDFQLFEKLGFRPLAMALIPGSGVDCRRFVPREPREDTLAPKRILFVGRVLWDKGMAEFIEAARILKDTNLEFVIAGDTDVGNPSSVPDDTLRSWIIEGLVTWLGHVEDMAEIVMAADIFVLPSYREGLPKSLIEAASCALPLIATDVPGCRDVITHEVDGLLVPVRDGKALAAAIRRLVDDKVLAARLGRAARARALTEFDERIVISRTLAVYDQLLPDRDGQAHIALNHSTV